MIFRLRHAALIAAGVSSIAATASPAGAGDGGLTRSQLRGEQISRQWQERPAIMTKGPDGTVIYLYGHSQPSVVCSPLQLCEVELQAGEVVRDVLVGDTVRWKVEPASSGSATGQKIHLVVKPAEAGLRTSMVVTTSRRTYHIRLVSTVDGSMARIAFSYPDEMSHQLEAVNARVEASVGADGGGAPENLNFQFQVNGSARWRPTRVYTDGVKTFIQFPDWVSSGDAPVLYVVSGGQNRLVNYRLKGAVMVVDYVFDNAVLLSGVGWTQEKVTIERRG